MKARLLALGRAFVNLIYPLSCSVCGTKMAQNTGLCEECLAKVQRNDHGIAACQYDSVIKKAVHLFKYSGVMSLVNSFSVILMEFIAKRIDMRNIDVIVPIPLHPVKLRERGFNQSGLLCGYISRQYGVPVEPAWLVKVRNTRPQSALNRKERLGNLKDAFLAKDHGLLRGKRVLLVDDISTTGTTIREAARALKKAGASAVRAVTLAQGV